MMPQKKPTTVFDEIGAEVDALDHELKADRLAKEKRSTDKKYSLLRDRVAKLETELDAFKSMQDVATFAIPAHKGHDGEATAVVLASDWHSEERVDPTTINGLNQFTLAIAEERINRFFVNVGRLLEAKQKSVRVKTLILALLGDFISGYIHEELVETAQLPPIEAIINVQNHLASGIRYLLGSTDVAITLPCHSGNHGRTTRRVHQATERGNSLEYFMYHVLANHFRDEKRVQFAIAGGYHSHADIHGFKIRFHHGHNVRYQGGVGGITIPVRKAIAQWNKSGPVDLDCFAHFHQLTYGGNFVCNSSLIGYNAFALSIKADYERPKQAFFLVNHRRKEVTDFCPVWLD